MSHLCVNKPDKVDRWRRNITFTGSTSASSGTVLVSIYGWTRNPLVEYYVVCSPRFLACHVSYGLVCSLTRRKRDPTYRYNKQTLAKSRGIIARVYQRRERQRARAEGGESGERRIDVRHLEAYPSQPAVDCWHRHFHAVYFQPRHQATGRRHRHYFQPLCCLG